MRFFKFFVIALIAFSLLVIATPAKSPPISQPDQRVQTGLNFAQVKSATDKNIPVTVRISPATDRRAADTTSELYAKNPGISAMNQAICANNSLFAPNLADEFLIRGNHSPGQETELTTNSTLRKPPEIVRLE